MLPGQGSLEVIDDGVGMTLSTIQRAWMEPATLYRKRRPQSEEFGRRVLGEKGIGRFAASRLAETLEVITRRRAQPKEVHVLFDWSQFDDEDRYLDEVEAKLWEAKPAEIARTGALVQLWEDETSPPNRADHGTILRMERLRGRSSAEQFGRS